MPVQSKLSQVLSYAELLLALFEKLSEQSFYESLLGERLVNLLKRYFGNDFVILSFVFYVSGIVKVKVTQLITRYFQKKKEEKTVVCIQIRSREYELYNAIEFIVRKRQSKIKGAKFDKLFAAYDSDPYYKLDDESDAESEPENTEKKNDNQVVNGRVIQFYPLDGTSNELKYKGHRVTVLHHDGKVEEDEDGSTELIGAYWEISMEGDSMEDLKELIRHWVTLYNSRGKKVTQQMTAVYKANSFNWQHMRSIKARSLESVTLRGDLKEKILQDIKMFKNRQNWYTSRGIPHRRGYLLHGPPGTGKTSLIQALAGELKMNLGILNMSEVNSDSGFADVMQKAPQNMMIVLEDFDRHMPSDNSGNSRVTLAGILNVLDGIQGQNGAIIFMTCNHIERIDPAILRPGRMDVKLHLDYADRKQIEDIFWRFFGVDYDTMVPVTGKRKEYLQGIQQKFADAIPPKKVTPAELESHFITVILACDAINLDEEGVFNAIFSEIPSFLEKIEKTRAGLGITSFNEKAEDEQNSVAETKNEDKSTKEDGEHSRDEDIVTKEEKLNESALTKDAPMKEDTENNQEESEKSANVNAKQSNGEVTASMNK